MVKLKGQIGNEDNKINCKNMQSKEQSQEISERMQDWEKVLAARWFIVGYPRSQCQGLDFFPLQYGHGEATIPYMKQHHLLLFKISWRRVASLLAKVKNKFTTIFKCKLHTCVRGIYRAQEQEPISKVENYSEGLGILLPPGEKNKPAKHLFNRSQLNMCYAPWIFMMDKC